MATKSNNTQGNPYHDEEGKFTSANGSGSVEPKLEDSGKHFSIRLKPNFDVSAARSSLQQQIKSAKTSEIPTTQTQTTISQVGMYREATNVEEAVAIGKSILPGCAVNYSKGCDIGKVNELNQALSDIANRFPGFVQNGLLNAYGDGISFNGEEIRHIIVQSALNVVQNDAHFKKIYDDFFVQSQQKYNLKDEDKYAENVFSHFMAFDRQFDVRDYTQNTGGGDALAYYQVSQDNIFSQNVGGKGINGAIKIYPDVLKTPTQRELAAVQRQIDSGFHFDYGGHGHTYGTGVHELGHSIFTIAYKKCNDEERAEIDQLLRDGTRKDFNQVSGYGHTNAYEQEAEAVADVMCRGDNATPHNKKMVAWLDKVHARLKKLGEV